LLAVGPGPRVAERRREAARCGQRAERAAVTRGARGGVRSRSCTRAVPARVRRRSSTSRAGSPSRRACSTPALVAREGLRIERSLSRSSLRKVLNSVVVGAVGSVGNPRPHDVRERGAPGGRGLSKRRWKTRSVFQGDGGQVVGSAHGSTARPALSPSRAAHELATGAVRRGTVHSPARRDVGGCRCSHRCYPGPFRPSSVRQSRSPCVVAPRARTRPELSMPGVDIDRATGSGPRA
jgi:hypothetical protein